MSFNLEREKGEKQNSGGCDCDAMRCDADEGASFCILPVPVSVPPQRGVMSIYIEEVLGPACFCFFRQVVCLVFCLVASFIGEVFLNH